MDEIPTIVPVACLRNNYAYIVYHPAGGGDCFVVDPSEAAPVQAEVKRRGLRLRAIVNTHHHWDHIGGNRALLRERPVPVVGHESETDRIPGMSVSAAHGKATTVLGMDLDVRHVPGHTHGAIALSLGKACFTGDTLFCGGCGRLFEGTAEQLHHSLTVVLAELPGNTEIYVGHEYTLSNLEFASSVLAHDALSERLERVRRDREAQVFCGTATLSVERETNPFLRCHLKEMQVALNASNAVEAFQRLRRLKDAA